MVLPAGLAPASTRLEDGGLVSSATEAKVMRMVARPGAAPGVSSSQARRVTVSLAHDLSHWWFEMAACAGFAPATFRSTGGCSSWLS